MSLDSITYHVLDVLTHVKRQFGDESGAQITDADILRWLNQAQLETDSLAKVIQAVSTSDLVAGTYVYPLPVEGALEITSLRVKGTPIENLSFQTAETQLQVADPLRVSTGTPQWWYRWAGQIYFWPTPDATVVGGIQVFFIKAPPVLTTGTDLLGLPDKYFEALVSFVMSKAYELDEDYTASQQARQMFSDRLGTSFEEDTIGSALFYPKITVVDME